MNKIHFDIIGSTNDYAKELLDKSSHNLKSLNETIIYADEQTGGRGRVNRHVHCPATGIYVSMIYVPENPVTNAALLTATTAVAISRAIKKVYNKDTSIKWVNDLYYEGKKVCGILTEGWVNYNTSTVDAAVIGFMVNIATTDFPDELKDKAISLGGDNSPFMREKLIDEIASEAFKIFKNQEETEKAFEEYRAKSFLIGQEVEVSPVINETKNNYKAKVIDVTDDAKLKVLCSDGSVKELDSGEITLHDWRLK